MAKKKDMAIDVSGVDVDYRGKLRNPDEDDDFRRSSGKKGKKKKDGRKERLDSLAEEEKPKRRKKKIDGPATDKQLAKLERRKEKFEAEIAYLPNATQGDEYDRQYRSMFDNLQTIIANFEERMLDSPSSRDVYALSTLYSQMREVIADIRSSKDVTQQIAELERRAYSAFLRTVGQSYVDLYFKLQKDIRTYVRDTEVQQQLLESLQSACKDQGDKVQSSYSSMLEQVRTVLM